MTGIPAQLQSALTGIYTLEREVGRGGMATVFLARDPKHDRRVAIKVLNPELGAVLGVERFLTEIRVTANLQHPNLLPLFDSGEAGGLLFYVMPFVEGETLRHRIDREKQLPVDEAVRIAVAIANALEYAHARGVIHRDLKPENILLQAGQPVVADFGIALAVSNAGGARVTATGLSLGTPQYMSPEQATGDRNIDARTDVYALGAIVYEMLSGEPPHSGTTSQAIIARLLTERPRRLRDVRPAVPEHVDAAVARALEKLPADRWTDAAGFREALLGRGWPSTPTETSRARREARSRLSRFALMGLVAAAVIGVFVGIAWLSRRLATPAPAVIRFTYAAPRGMRVRNTFGPLASISPDGRRIVYVGEGPRGTQLWIRDFNEPVARALHGTEDAQSPVFSPDGQSVAFMNSARLVVIKIPLGGGPPIELYPNGGPSGLAWISSDTVVHGHGYLALGDHLYKSPTAGGPAQPFLVSNSSPPSFAEVNPYLAPDAKALFFISRRVNGSLTDDQIAYTTLADRRAVLTGIKAREVLGYAHGHLLYADADGVILGVPFDLRRLRATGAPVATNETTQIDAYGPKAALSANGDLTYLSGADTGRAIIVGPSGTTFLMSPSAERVYSFPRYSPDGGRVAFSISEGARTDIWIYRIATGELERLTTEGTDNSRPEWSPDGRRVLYRSNIGGQVAMWWQPIDQSTRAERLTPSMELPVHEGVLTPDGKTLIYRIDTKDHARDVYMMSLQGDKTPRPVLATNFDEYTPRPSPDAKWLAYVSNESGRSEVYVRPFPGPGGRTLISDAGGQEPLWSSDGRRVYYRTPNAVVAATLGVTGGSIRVLKRETMIQGDFQTNRFHPTYDVTPDGKSFLMIQPLNPEVPLTVILNWTAGLARRFGWR